MMSRRVGILLAALFICITPVCRAQQSVNALFIGNSYTEVNNLPQMVQQIAASMGDQLTYQSNTPGGCTFSQHCGNRSMELICNGGWDIVVLQEQSQYPSFPQAQVEAEVFPFAQRLVDSAHAHSPCCEPMFYMTWGRKNGDAPNAQYYPVLGTYEGMDSMLCERYTYMAQQYDASLCPVGRVWRYLRENHRDIELYQSDDSHPSVAGTYAAACAFYVMFFHRDPDSISYDAMLPTDVAQAIRSAAHSVVYENLVQWQRPRPQATFDVEMLDDRTALFNATTLYADSLTWHFGDGNDTTLPATQTTMEHFYHDAGSFIATLIASRHCMTDSISLAVTIIPDSTEGIDDNTGLRITNFMVYPNPTRDKLTIRLPSNMEKSTVTLTNLDGRHFSSFEIQHSTFEVNVSDLPAGEYLLKISTPAGTVVRRGVVLK